MKVDGGERGVSVEKRLDMFAWTYMAMGQGITRWCNGVIVWYS